MKLVIDIHEKMYDWISTGFPDEEDMDKLCEIVRNGTPLEEPKTADEDLISRTDLLKDIADLKKSPWFNDGKYNLDWCRRNSYLARKEAIEIVEDLCIKKLPSAEKTTINSTKQL